MQTSADDGRGRDGVPEPRGGASGKDPEAAGDTSGDASASPRAAVLLIHGIGEQKPYSTLDAFARRLGDALGVEASGPPPSTAAGPEGDGSSDSGASGGAGAPAGDQEEQAGEEGGGRGPPWEHLLLRRKEWTASAVRMRLPQPLGREGARVLDLYEYYWAGKVQGRIRLWQVVPWLVRTALTPLRHWSRQAAVLAAERRGGTEQAPGGTPGRDPGKEEGQGNGGVSFHVFLRELLRSALLVAVAAMVVGPVLYLAGQWHRNELQEIVQALTAAASEAFPLSFPGILATGGFLLLLLCAVAIGVGIVRGALRMARAGPPDRRRRWVSPLTHTERAATRKWLLWSGLAFPLLLAGAWAVHEAGGLAVPQAARGLWNALTAGGQAGPVVLCILILAGGIGMSRVLVSYIGDIVLYVTADERSEFFRTRQEILSGAVDELRALLRGEGVGYKAVYVVGHSLGSVIAYDALNRLLRDARARGGEGRDRLEKLEGLVTLGSPLDKVYYFFREEVGDDQSVRAQLLSSLHAFRKRSSGRDYGRYHFARYEGRGHFPNLRWLNVWSPMDVVSGRLDFYELRDGRDRQLRRDYWNPIAAHNRYWEDEEVYRAFRDLCGYGKGPDAG